MNPSDIKEDLFELLRRDFASFVPHAFRALLPGTAFLDNWHIQAMCHFLTNRDNRIVISLPPRSLKSLVASVAFVAWTLGQDPTKQIICISYSQDLAEKNARQCRQLMESDWYKLLFPRTRISPEKNTMLQFETTAHGGRFSTSVMGPLTGFGADLIVIDDPLKAEDAMSDSMRAAVNEWYDNSVLSRLNNNDTGKIVIVMQRFHQDDLVGHVLKKVVSAHLCLPAIAEQDEKIEIGPKEFHYRKAGDVLHPARDSLKVFEVKKREMGSLLFWAQYQQNPLPADGGPIKWHWFKQYAFPLEREEGDHIVQSWDTAYKTEPSSDYSVCITAIIRGNLIYIIDVLREKMIFPTLRKRVVDHSILHSAHSLLVENRGSGMSLIQELRRGASADPSPIAIDPVKNKVVRMSTESDRIQAGYVFLPSSASWLEEFRREILQFPYGKHDDQIDALSQLLAWEKTRHSAFRVDWGNDEKSFEHPPPPITEQRLNPRRIFRTDPKTGLLVSVSEDVARGYGS